MKICFDKFIENEEETLSKVNVCYDKFIPNTQTNPHYICAFFSELIQHFHVNHSEYTCKLSIWLEFLTHLSDIDTKIWYKGRTVSTDVDLEKQSFVINQNLKYFYS